MKKPLLILFALLCNGMITTAQVVVTATRGASGIEYPTLRTAFTAINNGEHMGVIDILIKASTQEIATAVLKARGGLSDYSRVNIRPAKAVVISGRFNGPVIDLDGTDSVFIDGRINGTGTTRSLTIENTGTEQRTDPNALRIAGGVTNSTIQWTNLRTAMTPVYGAIVYIGSGNNTSGNSFNILDNNDIGPSVNGYALVAIKASNYKASVPNVMNQISNNHIHDIGYHVTGNDKGNCILIEFNDKNYLITGNSFYQTTPLHTGTAISITFIKVSGGEGHQILGNYIGGSAPSATGAPASYTTPDFSIYGISIIGGAAKAPHVVDGNVMTNLQLNAHGKTPNVFSGIYAFTNSYTDIGKILGNTIGSKKDTSAILINMTDTVNISRSIISGISLRDAQEQSINVSHNTIAGITLRAPYSTQVELHGIYGQLVKAVLTDNTIGANIPGSLQLQALSGTLTGICLENMSSPYPMLNPLNRFVVRENLIQQLYNSSRGIKATVDGILVSQGLFKEDQGENIILNNTIQQLHSLDSLAEDGSVKGINIVSIAGVTEGYVNSTIRHNIISRLYTKNKGGITTVAGIRYEPVFRKPLAIDSNRIFLLESAANNQNTFALTAVQGITLIGRNEAPASISGNTIYQLTSSAPATTTVYITGINAQLQKNNTLTISANRLYNFRKANGGAGVVTGGIWRGTNGAGNYDIINNMVSLWAPGLNIYGWINNATTANVRLYYNSVHIYGAATGNRNSAAFFRNAGTAGDVDMLNNIFQNVRKGGTGGHYAWINANTPPSAWKQSNYNNSYNTSGKSILWGNTALDLVSYQQQSGQDSCSKSLAVEFVQPATGDLHLQNTAGNHTLAATSIPGLTRDFDGDARAESPAMGADETIILAPKPVISAIGPTEFCKGQSVTLRSSLTTGNQWYVNDSLIAGATGQTYVASTSGKYVVYYSDGCIRNASDPTTVAAIEGPARPIISSPANLSICSSQEYYLSTQYEWFDHEFRWYLNGVLTETNSGSSDRLRIKASGVYTVQVVDGLCPSDTSNPINVTLLPSPPMPVISRIGDTLYSSAPSGNQWLVLENSPINGATDRKFVPEVDDYYAVRVTNDIGCFTTSEFILFEAFGTKLLRSSVKSTPGTASFKLYPNPAATTINLQLNGFHEIAQVQVHDRVGRLQLEQRMSITKGNTVTLDIQKLLAGTYLLNIISRKGEQVLTTWFTKM